MPPPKKKKIIIIILCTYKILVYKLRGHLHYMILPSVQFMLSRGFERRTKRLTKVLCKCSVIIMLKAFLILKKMK